MPHASITRSLLLVAAVAAARLISPAAAAAQQVDDSATIAGYRATADRLIAAATSDSAAWLRLAELTDRFGNRLSGSQSLERALDWVLDQMRADGLDDVHAERAMVPHWVRGNESLQLVEPRPARLPMLGLGGSIATPPGGITAPVLVVSDTLELAARAAEARGKIVLFDAPYVNYGVTVQYRAHGAVWASRVGAVAALLRSVSPFEMREPHTGVTYYDSTVRAIPFAAMAIEDAAMLHRMQNRGQHVVVTLKMEARTLPDAPSRNVIGELRGRERPDEVVVVSGHMDSWDVGTGAMDDGGGVMVAWEALRVMKRLGLRPRRTVRVVGWTNEENGDRGGEAYRDAHAAQLGDHDLAIESDGGVFRPTGLRVHRLRLRLRHRAPDRPAAGPHRGGYDHPRRRRHRHRADDGTRRAGDGAQRRRHPLLLVPPQRRRHGGQARPGRDGAVRGGHGGDGVRGGRPAGQAAARRTAARGRVAA